MPTIQHVGRQAVQPAIKREPESARGRKHGITEATDIPLTVPLSATEKGTLSHRKPPMTADAARPQSWGVARLSFRDAEKCRTSRHCTRKTSLHP